MDGMKELKWFGSLLAVLFLAWFISGGPERYDLENDKPFIKPPSPLNTGEIYGPENTAVNPNTPVGWKSVSTKYFSVALPTDWAFNESDSSVWNSYRGEFTNGSSTIFFEYGPYATIPVPTTDDRHTFTYETVASYYATMIKPTGFMGNTTGMFIDRAPALEKFSISGYNLNPSAQNTAFSIFRTLEFY
ncbi:hypothetical protein IPJ63_01360 [Candidatus Nomurabacteria bacterium]|nr:MAG: hypothetical protein IPJ63_01360 [Candidatus Nomurabacteria bacterium]